MIILSEEFTFKGRKLSVSKEDIEKALKNMKPSDVERPGFFLKSDGQFFRVKDVFEEIQKMKGLNPIPINNQIRYNVMDKFLKMGICVWKEVEIKGEKGIHLWKKYVKIGEPPFSKPVKRVDKMIKTGPYTFVHVGEFGIKNKTSLFLVRKSEKSIPSKKGIYLIFSSDEDSLIFYYVDKTENLNRELRKIVDISKILIAQKEDLGDEEGTLRDPEKFIKKFDVRFHSRFKIEDTPLVLITINMLTVVLNKLSLLARSVDVYFLEVKSANESDKIYSHMANFKPKWNMELSTFKKKKKEIYQLKVELESLRPKIWKKILVENTTSFAKLHSTIQILMGWTNEHLHAFYSGDYEIKNEALGIVSFLRNERDSIKYIYDFEDERDVKITLEKILPFDEKVKTPVYLDGEMIVPLEDSRE